MEITECDLKRQQRSGGAILIFKAYPTITYNRFMGNGTAQALEAGELSLIHISEPTRPY